MVLRAAKIAALLKRAKDSAMATVPILQFGFRADEKKPWRLRGIEVVSGNGCQAWVAQLPEWEIVVPHGHELVVQREGHFVRVLRRKRTDGEPASRR
jgi:hypothetical protein